jgi:hypothetical protein
MKAVSPLGVSSWFNDLPGSAICDDPMVTDFLSNVERFDGKSSSVLRSHRLSGAFLRRFEAHAPGWSGISLIWQRDTSLPAGHLQVARSPSTARELTTSRSNTFAPVDSPYIVTDLAGARHTCLEDGLGALESAGIDALRRIEAGSTLVAPSDIRNFAMFLAIQRIRSTDLMALASERVTEMTRLAKCVDSYNGVDLSNRKSRRSSKFVARVERLIDRGSITPTFVDDMARKARLFRSLNDAQRSIFARLDCMLDAVRDAMALATTQLTLLRCTEIGLVGTARVPYFSGPVGPLYTRFTLSPRIVLQATPQPAIQMQGWRTVFASPTAMTSEVVRALNWTTIDTSVDHGPSARATAPFCNPDDLEGILDNLGLDFGQIINVKEIHERAVSANDTVCVAPNAMTPRSLWMPSSTPTTGRSFVGSEIADTDTIFLSPDGLGGITRR